MSEQRVGDTFGGPGLDSRPKVGDDRVGAAVEDMDAREGAKRIDKARTKFYESLGMKPPKDGEPDAQIAGGDYLPGEVPVKVPKGGEKKPKGEEPKRGERKAQPALRPDKPAPAEEAEEPVEEEAAEEAPADEEEETTEEGVSPESEDAETESDEEEPSSDLEEEITVLRRAKVPQSVLKKMSQAEISRMAAIERERQSRMDDLGRQLGEARKQESGDEASAESGRVTPPEQPAGKSPVEPLLGILGDDAAPALSEYDRSIDARVDAAKKELHALYLDDLLDDAREALKDRFPELLNGTFFKNTIRPEMSVLHQSKLTKLTGATKRARLQSLMERAAINAREAKGLSNGRGDKAPAAPARKHGTVSPPKRTATPPKVGTTDRADAAWQGLMQGLAPKDVRRRLDSRA